MKRTFSRTKPIFDWRIISCHRKIQISNILPTVENYEKKIGKKKLSGNELKKRLESPTPTEL